MEESILKMNVCFAWVAYIIVQFMLLIIKESSKQMVIICVHL